MRRNEIMKKHILFAAGAMLAAVLMTGCGSKPAETTAAATAAETESTAVRLRYLQITRLQARP